MKDMNFRGVTRKLRTGRFAICRNKKTGFQTRLNDTGKGFRRNRNVSSTGSLIQSIIIRRTDVILL